MAPSFMVTKTYDVTRERPSQTMFFDRKRTTSPSKLTAYEIEEGETVVEQDFFTSDDEYVVSTPVLCQPRGKLTSHSLEILLLIPQLHSGWSS